MKRLHLPLVADGCLLLPGNGEYRQAPVIVGSEAWYAWLADEQNRSFSFRNRAGAFTIRCEQKRQSRYWYAYRKHEGQLRKAYLGKSDEVTLERLNAVAMLLAGQKDSSNSPHRTTSSLAASLAAEKTHEPGRTARKSLPVPLTPLIGREQEVEAVCRLLRCPEVRLFNLTGTGGVGKTRLGLQVATQLMNDFADGVRFVSLAPLSDPDLVIPTIAQALDLRHVGKQSPLEHLKVALRDKHLLLFLDNLERLVGVAPLLVELLQACPLVKILVTSRAVLHVRGEHVFLVQPLALPDLRYGQENETLSQAAAVQLFLQRAQAVKPTFQLTDGNTRVIAEVCIRLDGLPLAIELAASWIQLLSPQQLLARLQHRLSLLTGGAADLPERQQTLRNTLQWSYELLSEEEQQMFRRFSVFVGGCTLEAVEALYIALGERVEQVLNGVISLLDKHLLQQNRQAESEQRLMMLETIREFGQECLANSGETEATRRAHAEYYLALAEEAEPKLISAEQLQWLERLEQEYDNLRAALNYLLKREQFELALRMTGALWLFWSLRAHVKEGQRWLERALAGGSEVPALIRAKALCSAGSAMYFQGHWERAAALCKESLQLYRQVGDKRGIAYVLNGLAHIAFMKEDSTVVGALCEESLPLLREVGDRWRIAEALFLLAYESHARGDYATARALGEESLALCREVGDHWGTALVLQALGYFAYKQDDYAVARTLYEESLAACREMREMWITASSLAGLGEVVAAQGQLTWAARLWGATEVFCEALGTSFLPIERAAYESAVAATRNRLGEEAFTVAWAEGRTMSLEQVLVAREPVLAPIHEPVIAHSKTKANIAAGEQLTPRELEVLRLVAQGMTNPQIAEQLTVSLLTVKSHVRSIYNKLGFTSRSAAVRYAIGHGLV